MSEIWRQHPIYVDHEGSNLGRVRRKAIVRQHWNRYSVIERVYPSQLVSVSVTKRNGYRVFSVRYDGQSRRQLRVAAFLLECFIGMRPTPNFHACHNNGISNDDRIDNLRWDSPSANMKDRIKHGTQCRMFNEKNPLTKISTSDVVLIRNARGTLKEIADRFGISAAQVSRIRHSKSRAQAS